MTNTNKITYEKIAQKIRELPMETPCPNYKWEELVQRLCDSEDESLRNIGVRELEAIRQKCPNCPVFKYVI